MTPYSLLRARVGVPVIIVLLLIAAGLFWLDNRDDVTWSVEVDGATAVLDADADRLLLGTETGDLAVLDRRDGERVADVDLPAGAVPAQSVLLPDGGVLAAWRVGGGPAQAGQYDDAGTQLWQRSDGDGLRLLGVLTDLDLVAVATAGDDGAVLGLGADDGATRWRRPVAPVASWPDPATSGRTLLDVEVAMAVVGRDPSADPQILDLADGRTRGTADVAPDEVTGLAAWHEVVVAALADGGLRRWTEGEPTDLGGVDEDAVVTLGPVVDGRTEISAGAGPRLSLDLVQGEAVPATDLPRGARVLDEEAQRAVRWLRGTDDELSLLTVVDADDGRHGALVVPEEDVVALAVLEGHEAVVVTRDRVVLLGRS